MKTVEKLWFATVGAIVVAEAYQAYKTHMSNVAEAAAHKWGQEAEARLYAMREHAVKNRMKLSEFGVTIGAAKNVLMFEAAETNPGNVYMSRELKRLLAILDKWFKETI